MGIFSKSNDDHPDRKRDLTSMLRDADQHETQERPFVRQRIRTETDAAYDLQKAVERKRELEGELVIQNDLISALAKETEALCLTKNDELQYQMEHTNAILKAVTAVQEAGNELQNDINRSGHGAVASALGVDRESGMPDTEAGNQGREDEQPDPLKRALQVPKDQHVKELQVLESHISGREKGPSYHENEPSNEPGHGSPWPKRHRLVATPTTKEIQRD